MEINNGLIIIDSGFDTTNTELYKSIIGGVSICDGKINDDFEDLNGHGTACTYIARRYNKDINIFMIRVLDQNAKCSIENLIAALEYTKKINIRTICLSLSTPTENQELLNICNELILRGKILVAALNNNERISFPAMYEGVIGVRNTHLENEFEFWFDNNKEIQCVVDGTPVLVPCIKQERCFFGGNSKATPIIASRISRYLSEDKLLVQKEIESYLKRDATKIRYNIDEIDKHIKVKSNKFDKNNKVQVKIKELVEKTTGKLIDIDLLEKYRLYELGLDKYNTWQLIKDLEFVFDIRLDYETISLRDFATIQSINDLVLKYFGGGNHEEWK